MGLGWEDLTPYRSQIQLFAPKQAFGHIIGPERHYLTHMELFSSLFEAIAALESDNHSKSYFSSE
ncbi:hypothetical protein D3C76_308910 [compost metagenome]